MSAIGTLEEAAPPARLARRGGARDLAASVEAGNVFTYAQVEDEARRALLTEVLEAVASPSRKVIRVGNQLRAPLTIERIMIQAAGPDADSGVEHDPALLASLLAKQAEADGGVLVVIEQPETINAEAVELLQSMRAHLLAGCVQMLLAGRASAAQVLSDIEEQEGVPVRQEAPAVVLLETPKRASIFPEPIAAPRRPRRAMRLAVAMMILFGIAGVLLGGIGSSREWLLPALANWHTISRPTEPPLTMTGSEAREAAPARARTDRWSAPTPGRLPPVLVQEAFESGRVTVRLPGSHPAAPLAGLPGSN